MRIGLSSGNPYDASTEDLQDLMARLGEREPDVEFEVATPPERGYGVTLIEVINLTIQTKDVLIQTGEVATGVVATAALPVGAVRAFKRTVTWARERREKDQQASPNLNARPRSVRLIYGPTGEVLKSVTIDSNLSSEEDDL